MLCSLLPPRIRLGFGPAFLRISSGRVTKTCLRAAPLALLLPLAPAARAQETAPPIAPAPASAPASEEPSDFDLFEEEFGEEARQADVFDPLSGYNRFMFRVNDKFYFWLAKPTARAYEAAVPQPGRLAVGRAYANLRFPLRFVNSLLQLKLRKAGSELGRFVVNSTLGLGGFFDVAEAWTGWRAPSDEDLGQTFGHWGVGPGFPVVLPILGQSNLRDGLALAPSFVMNPVWYVADSEINFAVAAGEQFNFVSLHLGEYESIKKDALDPYTFIRDAYEQNRKKKIRE